MSRQHHELKIETQYYQDIENGLKTSEIRRNNNDRDYHVYDIVWFKETVDGVETGRKIGPFEITYLVHGPLYGLQEGYCIFALTV